MVNAVKNILALPQLIATEACRATLWWFGATAWPIVAPADERELRADLAAAGVEGMRCRHI